jgi:hypothetical protein
MTTLIVMRLLASCILAGGSVWLAYHDKEGWGWMLFGAIWLGSITMTTK